MTMSGLEEMEDEKGERREEGKAEEDNKIFKVRIINNICNVVTEQ